MSAKIFSIPVTALQPSQLYISAAKLQAVRMAWQHTDLFPLPVKWMIDRWMLTDGHTRAFEAWRTGQASIMVQVDEDDLDWEAYKICLGWCIAEGIRSVADLAGRILPEEDYSRLWHDRCARMQADLEAGRNQIG